MIEVVGFEGEVTKYETVGTEYRVIDGGHLSISEEFDDRGHMRNVAIHAAGTWAIARKVTA